MRLLIVTQAVDLDDQNLGFFHEWIKEFAKHCEAVSVICLRAGRHELPHNVSVRSLEKGSRAARALRFYRFIFAARRDYDAVFVHMNPEYVVLAGAWWRLTGKRVGLWYAHGSLNAYLRASALLVNVIFSSSSQGMRLRSRKLLVVGQGIDTDVFSPAPSRATREAIGIISSGRLSASKRVREMIEACGALREKHVRFRFLIVGGPATDADAAYASGAKKLAAGMPCANDIEFIGPRPHASLPDLLRESDVFLNLSETGSLDKAVLEALSCEVPAVTSNVAYREMLGPYGLFVESADPDAVSDAIIRANDAPRSALRALVERDHSLRALIPRLLAALS